MAKEVKHKRRLDKEVKHEKMLDKEVKRRLCDYIVFPRTSLFILGLYFSRGLVDYAVTAVFIGYITSQWGSQNLPKAVSIVNLQAGVSSFMVIILARISDMWTGRFLMVVITTPLYIIGLVLLCVEDARITEEWVFYVAVLLTALGTAGLKMPLKEFVGDQLRKRESVKPTTEVEPTEVKRINNVVQIWRGIPYFSGCILSMFTLSKNVSWAYKFKVSAIAIGVAYLLFWFGLPFYTDVTPPEKVDSPLTLLYDIPKAAISKRHLDYPSDPTKFHRNDKEELILSPPDRCLRWLDKAAILESTPQCPQEQFDQGKVFQVRQVRAVKLLFRMVPMWTTFIFYSVVQTTGNTFFITQAAKLNDKIGSNGLTLPTTVFFLVISFSNLIFGVLCDQLKKMIHDKELQHRCTLVRIGFGMVTCILCCVTALQVEIRRLHTISMSIYWLIPQYCLLGVMKRLAEEGLKNFFNTQFGQKTEYRIYEQVFTECALSIGKFVSIACVQIFQASFGDSINWSRFDHYYKMLVFLCVGNLFYYICISMMYCNQSSPVEEEDLAAAFSEEDLVGKPGDQALGATTEDPNLGEVPI
ncbi:protein NRT1/ PTR FAMILY 5.6-like [Cornus florida]|uniref:protein NRT1/ PTR FAMILY 5.6-like n=1 Tax=Cornus florida TaxID=4283 RepID=UPI00289E8209|nr:protein NRT1/ PTR FAMILY 5.6-like [Cornus florida]